MEAELALSLASQFCEMDDWRSLRLVSHRVSATVGLARPPLVLSVCGGIERLILAVQTGFARRARAVDLRRVVGLTDAAMLWLVEQLCELRVLDVSGCMAIGKEALLLARERGLTVKASGCWRAAAPHASVEPMEVVVTQLSALRDCRRRNAVSGWIEGGTVEGFLVRGVLAASRLCDPTSEQWRPGGAWRAQMGPDLCAILTDVAEFDVAMLSKEDSAGEPSKKLRPLAEDGAEEGEDAMAVAGAEEEEEDWREDCEDLPGDECAILIVRVLTMDLREHELLWGVLRIKDGANAEPTWLTSYVTVLRSNHMTDVMLLR